jgi:transcriptional regulator NrdR family protein
MDKSITCPACGRVLSGKPLKTWKFRIYNVKRYECEHCKVRFNTYEAQKAKFTIPKAKGTHKSGK